MAFFLTARSGDDLGLRSQAKVAAISETTNLAAVGYLVIDYDVLFMHPELETGYAGVQYQNATDTVGAYTANANLTWSAGGSSWPSLNVKVAEIVSNSLISGLYRSAAANPYTINIGELLYTAWSGVEWQMFPDLVSAISLNNPLKWIGAGSAFSWNYFVRPLTKDT